MIVDPVQAVAAAASSVAPIPTVLPTIEYQDATDAGKTTLWVVTIIMAVSAIVFMGLSWSIPISKRLYHIVTTLIVVFAAISYFAMANGEGVSYHHVTESESHSHGQPTTTKDIYRQVYYARYIDWSLTTPLLLLDLALLAGLNGGHTFIAIVADLIMILTGLFGAFSSKSSLQWGWFVIANLAFLVVIYVLAVNGRSAAATKSGKVGGFFTAIAAYTMVLWIAYPVAFGLADGSRIATVDSEILLYAILDVLAKPVFGAWLLYTHAKLPETNVELGGYWANGLTGEGAIRVGDDDEGA